MATISGDIVSSSLPTHDLGLLRRGDLTERARLLQTCEKYGFFYLDLRSDSVLLDKWQQLLDAMAEYFAQPQEVKMQDDRASDNTGYEPAGTSAGDDLTSVDSYESLKVSRREQLNGSAELTSSAKQHEALFFDFIRSAHGATLTILSELSDACGLTGPDRFEVLHDDASGPGLSTLGMLRYPKHDGITEGKGHNKHTDVGTLTFLLCKQWGLQILSPDTASWAFVEPREGHAVVNVGDSLRFVSGFRFASVVHRVTPLYDVQHEDRYSIAYFLRMADNATFRDQDGKAWSAKDWHDFKFDIFRKPFDLPDGTRFLTGGMESGDVLLRKEIAG